MERKAKHATATAGKAEKPYQKCYGPGKIAQRMTTAQSNAFKAMEDTNFEETESLHIVYANKIAYNKKRVANEEDGARKVSMHQAEAQCIDD